MSATFTSTAKQIICLLEIKPVRRYAHTAYVPEEFA